MAIPNMQTARIQPGRVESDPMQIPVSTTMRQDRQHAFDRVLQRTVADEEPRQPIDDRATDDRPLDEPVAADDAPTAAPEQAREHERTDTTGDENDASAHGMTADEGADVTDGIRRGDSEQSHEAAGKGTRSPRTSTASSPAAADADGTPLDRPTGTAHGANAPSLVATQANRAPAPAVAVEPGVRGGVAASPEASGALRTRAAQAGYGARSTATLQLLDQARDSVFKQILMKLNDDGGEMRMTLQPPELGELDLRLTVEGGNRLSLHIAAERGDMGQLLQRHLDELKQTLQQNGLEVTDAEVSTREEFARRQQDHREHTPAHAGADDAHHGEAPVAPAARGYLTADGLDFWA